jgi:hypothetical protein
MDFKKSLIILAIPSLFGCESPDKVDTTRPLSAKDTINVVDIVSDFKTRLNTTGAGVKLQFFDKESRPIIQITESDTFFVRVDYVSDRFINLAKNHEIELVHANGNFEFIAYESKNKFKLVVGYPADTIAFDVFLKSKKYIFNDYFIENGEIAYELTNRIQLCRLTELTMSK